MNEEAENIGPVIDGDDDHAFAGHVLAVITWLRTVAALEATSENIEQNRELLRARFGSGPDVEVQAFLAHPTASEPVIRSGGSQLHAPWSEVVGIADARPTLDGLGLAPA